MSEDDLRGSTPIYTAKDVLVKLDSRVEGMDGKIDTLGSDLRIIASQNLNERIILLEREAQRSARAADLAESHETQLQRLAGAQAAVRLMFGASLFSAIASGVAIAKALGVI